MRLVIACHNPTCPDSVESRPTNPVPMVCTGETFSAWTFKCMTCRSERVMTKDLVGGTMGSGRRDDGWGTTTGKGGSRYRNLGRV
jgi:hypothetical protein